MCRDPLIRFTEDAMERAAGEFRAIHEAVVVLDYFKDLPDPASAWQSHLSARRVAVPGGAETFVDIARFGEKKIGLFRRFRPFRDGTPSHDHPRNCEDNPRPPRYTPLSRSRRPRDQRRKWKHWVTSSLSTVRRTAEGGWLCSM